MTVEVRGFEFTGSLAQEKLGHILAGGTQGVAVLAPEDIGGVIGRGGLQSMEGMFDSEELCLFRGDLDFDIDPFFAPLGEGYVFAGKDLEHIGS